MAASLATYQTSGNLQIPLVTIHTLLDPDDPGWHQALYRMKVWNQNKAALYRGIPINRYGHRNFQSQKLLFAFALAYTKATHQLLTLSGVGEALPSSEALQQFEGLMRQYQPVAE